MLSSQDVVEIQEQDLDVGIASFDNVFQIQDESITVLYLS